MRLEVAGKKITNGAFVGAKQRTQIGQGRNQLCHKSKLARAFALCRNHGVAAPLEVGGNAVTHRQVRPHAHDREGRHGQANDEDTLNAKKARAERSEAHARSR